MALVGNNQGAHQPTAIQKLTQQEEHSDLIPAASRCAATPAQNSTVGSSDHTAATLGGVGSQKSENAPRGGGYGGDFKDPETKKIDLNARVTYHDGFKVGKPAAVQQQSPTNGDEIKNRTIGNYVVGKSLGQGTFGKVRIGTHTLTQESVAIKILEKDKIKDRADVERVTREISILKRVRHPNVIQLYEIIETSRQLFLIMEYAAGGELFEYIVKNKRLKELEASRFYKQIISGVEYIHKCGVCHRDLKPENLLLDDQLQIKIVDFGLSNTYEPAPDLQLTGQMLKTACGSPCYAAPEMIAGKRYHGLAADLWSTGIILFAMTAGYLPFEDPNTNKLYKKILSCDYTLPNFIPSGNRDLIQKLLQTDPTKRFTIQDIRRHEFYRKNDQSAELQGIIIGKDKIPVLLNQNQNDEESLSRPSFLSELGQFYPQGSEQYEQAEQYIQNNKHNPVTATYYLLIKKLERHTHRNFVFESFNNISYNTARSSKQPNKKDSNKTPQLQLGLEKQSTGQNVQKTKTIKNQIKTLESVDNGMSTGRDSPTASQLKTYTNGMFPSANPQQTTAQVSKKKSDISSQQNQKSEGSTLKQLVQAKNARNKAQQEQQTGRKNFAHIDQFNNTFYNTQSTNPSQTQAPSQMSQPRNDSMNTTMQQGKSPTNNANNANNTNTKQLQPLDLTRGSKQSQYQANQNTMQSTAQNFNQTQGSNYQNTGANMNQTGGFQNFSKNGNNSSPSQSSRQQIPQAPQSQYASNQQSPSTIVKQPKQSKNLPAVQTQMGTNQQFQGKQINQNQSIRNQANNSAGSMNSAQNNPTSLLSGNQIPLQIRQQQNASQQNQQQNESFLPPNPNPKDYHKIQQSSMNSTSVGFSKTGNMSPTNQTIMVQNQTGNQNITVVHHRRAKKRTSLQPVHHSNYQSIQQQSPSNQQISNAFGQHKGSLPVPATAYYQAALNQTNYFNQQKQSLNNTERHVRMPMHQEEAEDMLMQTGQNFQQNQQQYQQSNKRALTLTNYHQQYSAPQNGPNQNNVKMMQATFTPTASSLAQKLLSQPIGGNGGNNNNYYPPKMSNQGQFYKQQAAAAAWAGSTSNSPQVQQNPTNPSNDQLQQQHHQHQQQQHYNSQMRQTWLGRQLYNGNSAGQPQQVEDSQNYATKTRFFSNPPAQNAQQNYQQVQQQHISSKNQRDSNLMTVNSSIQNQQQSPAYSPSHQQQLAPNQQNHQTAQNNNFFTSGSVNTAISSQSGTLQSPHHGQQQQQSQNNGKQSRSVQQQHSQMLNNQQQQAQYHQQHQVQQQHRMMNTFYGGGPPTNGSRQLGI